ncbi:MAG: hypothetical protein DWI22_10165 [Planctomycetota bacterium]|nr:MAG: hypothetical protein DWI22_10165 [Planctomycetota bacterium]
MFQNARLRSGDGQFDSEEDAAVGKTDCTTMLKLVPFDGLTGAVLAHHSAGGTRCRMMYSRLVESI